MVMELDAEAERLERAIAAANALKRKYEELLEEQDDVEVLNKWNAIASKNAKVTEPNDETLSEEEQA